MDKIKVEPPPAGYVRIYDPFSGYTRTVPEDQVYFPDATGETARRVEAWREFEQARDALLNSASEGPSMVHFGTERGRWSSSGKVEHWSGIYEPGALGTQVGGDHYKNFAIQPIEFTQANKVPPCEASVIKYVMRHRFKNGREDIEKAIHYLRLLLEIEYGDPES